MFQGPHAVSGARLALHWRRFDEAEVDLCRRLSRVRRRATIGGLFHAVSCRKADSWRQAAFGPAFE